MTRRCWPRALALAAIPFVGAGAQQGAAARAPSERATTACAGQRIDDVVIYADAPSVANLQRVPVLASMAQNLHITTRTEVVRRYLLLRRGEPCVELRRAESERILRAQPFIADADIFVVPNAQGGVDLEVRTSDEGAVVLGGSVRARAPMVTHVLLGNANVAGGGVYSSLSWRSGEGLRDGVSARVIDHQFLGRPMTMLLEAERASLGGNWRIEGTRPFYTDLQRLAWRTQTGASRRFLELRAPDGTTPAIDVTRSYFEAGALARVGPPGRLLLVGASITGTDESSSARLVDVDSGVMLDGGAVRRPYPGHRVGRLNVLFGLRDIRFVRRDSLDALSAAQDVPVGVQVGTTFGRSLRVLGSREDDSFASGELYAGYVGDVGVLRLQLRGEARRGLDVSAWDGVVTSGRVTQYVTLGPRHMHQTSIEFSGAFRARTPYQLQLGVPGGGIRGFERSSLAAGRRVVARAEERWALGRLRNAGDIGAAVFADAGRQWAGSVPFGVTTGLRGSVGVSLLAAVPVRSSRAWRADLAVPLGAGAGARWTLGFTNADRTQFIYREPRDITDAREPTAPASLFSWP